MTTKNGAENVYAMTCQRFMIGSPAVSGDPGASA
jgi:hypothetical protein